MKNKVLKLEVGNGLVIVVKIASKEPPFDLFPNLSDKGEYYKSNGTYFIDEHPEDLIKEFFPESKQMKNTKFKTKVVLSQTKLAWNVINEMGGKYKIARVPYVGIRSEEGDNMNMAEAFEHATFISDCFNNMNKKKEAKNEMKNENINLEVGKSYLNRKGHVIKIVGKNQDPLGTLYTYISDTNSSYQSNGKYCVDEHPEDLIKEVPMQKKEDKKEVLKLEVGKRYLNRMGEVVKIVRNERNPLHPLYPYISDKGYSYLSNGKYCSSGENKEDLIKEVTPESIGRSYTTQQVRELFYQLEHERSEYIAEWLLANGL